MTLLFSLKNCLEMKLLNVLIEQQRNSTLYVSVFVKWNYFKFWSNAAKTVQRLQMDLENMRCVGNCCSFVQSCWASRSCLQTAQPRKGEALHRGWEWEMRARFPFPRLSLLGVPDCFLGRGIELWKEQSQTKREATNELECSGVKRKTYINVLGSCQDYYRMKKKCVQFINSLII